MKIQDIFGTKGYLSGSVPLSIAELGFAYLNDIGLWNITINNKNVACVDNKITVAQLKDIFLNHCSCYPTQQTVLETEKQAMLHKLEAFDLNEIIDLS